jgi:methylamine dehydrogenase heavy chain
MNFKWSMWRSVAMAVAGAAGLAGVASAGDPLPIEKLVMKPTIDSKGPLFFTNNDRILVGDIEKFTWQGVIGQPTFRGQFLPTKGGQVIVSNSWWERGNAGKRTDIIEFWDVSTLSKAAVEVEVPPRLALRGNDATMLGLSSDEKFLFLQNATPATSVTVVDMTTKKFASEIPTPGCFGIYPATGAPGKFVALCGDGTAATVTVDAKGMGKIARSAAFFNADTDPLFPKSVRDGDTLYFASFLGSIYKVDISGPTATLVEKFSIVEGVPGGWKPATENGFSYAPEAKVMFVSMFPKSGDGDHRTNAKQVWAVDVAGKKVLSRSTLSKSSNGIAYTAKPVPALLVSNPDDKSIDKYILQPTAGYSMYLDKSWVVNVGALIQVQ